MTLICLTVQIIIAGAMLCRLLVIPDPVSFETIWQMFLCLGFLAILAMRSHANTIATIDYYKKYNEMLKQQMSALATSQLKDLGK